jgi:Leucine-rich repeat (LRR) protein
MGLTPSKNENATPGVALDNSMVIELPRKQLSALPEYIKQRGDHVSKLILDFNDFEFLPDDKTLESFPNVEELSLASNCVKEVSDAMINLKRLRILNLGANQLTCIFRTHYDKKL